MLPELQNAKSVDDLGRAQAEFEAAYPAFADTRHIDELRAEDYGRLDAQKHVYLDYTGGSLYGQTQLQEHVALLAEGVFGNPHSTNPSSMAMTRLVERTRRRVLEFFNASPEEYVVVFTPNATGALKLVGEAYPFAAGGHFALTFDNHNSVNGIREFARARGADTTYVRLVVPDLHTDSEGLDACLQEGQAGAPNLFAFPAQSNFSGVQHPLEWIDQAHKLGWDVLLDAAAFVPTNTLDLGRWKPDYVAASFYKIFGYPTGVGCLVAHRDALARLRRPWFAGGTITVASVKGDRYYLAEGTMAFEDGTCNYLCLPAVEIGLRHVAAVGRDAVHERVRCLASWLLNELVSLRHGNGAPLVRIYGPVTDHGRGGTITMNFYDPQGTFFDHLLVEQKANAGKISLRTGCFCNPGAGESALGLTRDELVTCFAQHPTRFTPQDFHHCIDRKSTGAVRVSLGLVSNFADVYRFAEFARGFLDQEAAG